MADTENATGFLFKTLQHEGQERKYAVYVPREYDPGKEWPLIMFLHGYGESGTDGSKPIAVGIGTAILIKPEEWPFIVVFPQKPEFEAQWEQYEGMVMAMLARTQEEYSVSPNRLYLTGLSQGGHGTWEIGAHHTDVWAAIAPICGYGEPQEIAGRLKSMPLWAFHGDADPVVPVERTTSLVTAVEDAGGRPAVSIYPNVGHNSWDQAYREERLGEWFLTHQKGAEPQPFREDRS